MEGKRTLKINLDELCSAVEYSFYENEYYQKSLSCQPGCGAILEGC